MEQITNPATRSNGVASVSVISWKALHPERFARARERQNWRMARKVATGRAGKDMLMPKARAVATSGACFGWIQVLNALEGLGVDTALLRIWATVNDKDEIDRLCRRARAATARRR
jgi:hypothetical protein